MRRRRSVRHFSSEPAPHELVENAIRTAATAPSGANQQPWTFVVVSDPAVKLQIRAAAEREEELLYRERASREYLEAIEPIGTDWIKPHITDAPYLIVVFEQAWGRGEMGDKKKHYYVRQSVGIAVGFLLAALHRRRSWPVPTMSARSYSFPSAIRRPTPRCQRSTRNPSRKLSSSSSA